MKNSLYVACLEWGLIMGTGVDMRSTSKTRVQRRVEKKQVALLVVLVLVIALTSFVLGVIVGRNTAEPMIVQQEQEPRRIVVADTVQPQPGEQFADAGVADEKLTFYDNLSKEEPAPIGSGINLPPEGEAPVVEELTADQPQAVKEPVSASEVVAAVKEQAAPAAAPAPTPVTAPVPAPAAKAPAASAGEKLPGATKGGGWVVQVFASQSAADAGTLRDKLNGKGYPAFIAEADLGKKGIWYRVNLGPYANKSTAQKAQAYAEKKDRLKGFAKRR